MAVNLRNANMRSAKMNFLSTGFDFQFGETNKIYLEKGMIEMY